MKKYQHKVILSAILLAIVVIVIITGQFLEAKGMSIRRWHWTNLLYILPLVPLVLLQKTASLPGVQTVWQQPNAWWHTAGIGALFGLLDVLVIKALLHPQPYTELPPFLQPFPYSLGLYTAGALEVEIYYRMLPLTIFLLLDKCLFQLKHRKVILIALGIISSLIEPIQQFPDGKWWFILYATLSGIAMNGFQYTSYNRYGFTASLLVRLGHYFIWHILLGIYVQFIELR